MKNCKTVKNVHPMHFFVKIVNDILIVCFSWRLDSGKSSGS